MSDRHIDLARRWLEKADHDVITAQQTLLLLDGPTDTPCFHAQQAVEKVLKALGYQVTRQTGNLLACELRQRVRE